MRVRPATIEDASGVRAIYEPIVRDTAISFELEVPSTDELASRIAEYGRSHAFLVADAGADLLGYAYGGPFRPRSAYAPSVEVSAYVADHARGRGAGRALLGEVLSHLEAAGFVAAMAGITLPNPASVALFEGFGFSEVGVFRACGYKLGKWHDVGWWQKLLRDPAVTPGPGGT